MHCQYYSLLDCKHAGSIKYNTKCTISLSVRMEILLMNSPNYHDCKPVSYTHLDVYKRQAYRITMHNKPVRNF